ncbi:Ig-like domain-containing protein [Paraglaciecola sp.]|uniref:Ig-like domain-containing protein n=1 Tax=Paraglaciecola sp. TaxID=1920173 RepID=UPI003EF8C81B
MKCNLLKNAIIYTAVTAALAGCGGGDSDGRLPDATQPVVLVGNTTENQGDHFSYMTDATGDIHITVTEGTGSYDISLLEGVTSEGKTKEEGAYIYAVDFFYYKNTLNPDGTPVLDAEGNADQLWIGPDFPGPGVGKTSERLTVNSDEFVDLLVHPHTVQESNALEVNMDADPANDTAMMYSEGIYKFKYELDNGTPTNVIRNITLTVKGAEDKVEEVVITNTEGFEVPKGYDVQVLANVLPANSTFSTILYSSSDDTVATVSSSGLVTGVEFGTFTIIATSHDGEVVSQVSGEVVQLKDPVGIEIANNNGVVLEDWIGAGSSKTLSVNLLPLDVTFEDIGITWESSAPEIVSVSEDGMIEGVNYNNVDPTLSNASITATLTDTPSINFSTLVNVTPGTNLMYSGNPSFNNAWDDTILTKRTADNSPGDQLNIGEVMIVEDGDATQTALGVTTVDGRSLYVDSTAGDVRVIFKKFAISQAGFRADTDYVLSYDLKMISGKFQTFFNPVTGGWFPAPGWWQFDINHSELDENKMMRITHNIGAGKIRTDGSFLFNLHTSGGANGGQYYLDNFKIERAE